jgi:hypothetical protein
MASHPHHSSLFISPSIVKWLIYYSQPTKRPIDLVIDYLHCIGEYAKSQITRDMGAIAGLGIDL